MLGEYINATKEERSLGGILIESSALSARYTLTRDSELRLGEATRYESPQKGPILRASGVPTLHEAELFADDRDGVKPCDAGRG